MLLDYLKFVALVVAKLKRKIAILKAKSPSALNSFDKA